MKWVIGWLLVSFAVLASVARGDTIDVQKCFGGDDSHCLRAFDRYAKTAQLLRAMTFGYLPCLKNQKPSSEKQCVAGMTADVQNAINKAGDYSKDSNRTLYEQLQRIAESFLSRLSAGKCDEARSLLDPALFRSKTNAENWDAECRRAKGDSFAYKQLLYDDGQILDITFTELVKSIAMNATFKIDYSNPRKPVIVKYIRGLTIVLAPDDKLSSRGHESLFEWIKYQTRQPIAH